MRPTERQMEALVLIAEGHSRADLSRLMGYNFGCPSIGNALIDRLYTRLGARNAPHAVHIAYQEGYL